MIFAEVSDTPEGSELVGELRLHRAVAVFTAVWVAGAALFTGVLAAVALATVVVGGTGQNDAPLGMLFTLGFDVLALAMFELQFRMARPDEEFCLRRLAELAAPAAPGGPG